MQEEKQDTVEIQRADAVKEIAVYYHDIKMLKQLKDMIMERYKGALAAQPIGSLSGDNRTGDPERRTLEIEDLEQRSVLAGRLKRVREGFVELFVLLDSRKCFIDVRTNQYRCHWTDTELFNLMDAIIDNCENKVTHNYTRAFKKYNLMCTQRTFERYKAVVVNKVLELKKMEVNKR